ncbi:hypothetical protein SDC9_68435 [bioreactor metagenome]|uniref:Xylose isomerase-like TIM barrel domain-containing protein n=1 Tax=bioreactor metagenome TaxID=1076179 RepID=A0A644Y0E8_9ZZZZ
MMKADDLRLDLSSLALHDGDTAELVRAARKLAEPHGFTVGVQVHNTASAMDLERMAGLGVPLSFHTPILSEYVMNLAAADNAPAFAVAEEQMAFMRRYKVDRAVFHGFRMTDLPIPAFGNGRSYDYCMKPANRPELARREGSRFVCDFTADPEFLMRRDRVKANLALLRKRYPAITWCVENDFPAYGSGNLRGSDLAYLEHPVCLDTGHLWASAKMLGFDFYREMQIALDSGHVRMIHFHASRYTFDMDHEDWGDGHLPLDHPTAISLARVAQACRAAGVGHYVLEIPTATLRDVETFLRLYLRAGA